MRRCWTSSAGSDRAVSHAFRPSRCPRHFASPTRRTMRGLPAQLLAGRDGWRPSARRASMPRRGGWSAPFARVPAALAASRRCCANTRLSTPEGLALMVLAEGLLRVPDDATADRLIEDKLGQGGFAAGSRSRPDTLLVRPVAWALGLSARLVGPADTPEGIMRGVVRRLGLPTVRAAMRKAMRVMGSHFVLGQSIDGRISARRTAVPGECSGIVSTCLARARAPMRMRGITRRVMRRRSRRSAMRRVISRCRTGLGYR